MPTVKNPENAGRSARRLAYYAILTALAVVLSAAESFVPIPVPAPGFKLGLANVVTLVILLEGRSPAYAITVTAIRCFVTAFLFGTFSALLFSLSGGLLSCIVMWFLLHFNFIFSVIGISVTGALSHNFGQLAAASFVMRDTAVFSYAPILIIAGVAAGSATGIIAGKTYSIIKSYSKNY